MPERPQQYFALTGLMGTGPERVERRHHKPHPPHPEKTRRQRAKAAGEGDQAAVETLRTAPRRQARDHAARL